VTSALPVPSLSQWLAGFAALAARTAEAKLTYRLATILSIVTSGFAYCVFLLVWLAVYRENPNPGPIDRTTMMAYLVAAFVVNAVLNLSLEFRFIQRVRMGLVGIDLLRPIGFLPFQMAQGVGDALVNLVFVAPVLGVGFWFVGSALAPPSLLAGALGVVSVMLAFVVNFALSYLIVQASFVLQSGYGVLFARAALHQIFSGLAAPLVMFPEALRHAAELLPFRYVIETPVLLLLGLAPTGKAPAMLAGQLAWGIGLLACGELIFRSVMKRQQIQGG
jgi:ABC-2 type transport system permease protein